MHYEVLFAAVEPGSAYFERMSWIDQGRTVEGVDLLAGVLARDPGNRRAVNVLARMTHDAEVRPRVI